MKKETYYEMVKLTSCIIHEACGVLSKTIQLSSEYPNEVINKFNPFITALVQSEIVRVYGEKDAYEFFNTFGGESSESLANHIETMIDNGDLVVKDK